ncbi:MAG: hypothetical protein AAGU76_06290 [Sedimentibacter sp.]|uniref:hypothetical protein n=1 Tax=Sedimentibacter sp. TaxID=1960295 RepID=UPI00315846DF
MFDKKKLNFLRLSVLFSGMTITILFLMWSSPNNTKSAMMNTSMVSMMKDMHVSDLSMRDLLQNPGAQNYQQESDIEEHHEDSPLYKIGILTTSVVFLLIPFLIGGSVMLGIIWIR